LGLVFYDFGGDDAGVVGGLVVGVIELGNEESESLSRTFNSLLTLYFYFYRICSMKIDFPKSINSDFYGYSFLSGLYHKICALEFDDITLDFQNTTFLAANLLSILGAILNSAEYVNNIKIINLTSKIEILLKRNHFLSHFGGHKLDDFYGTTIKYMKFKPTDNKQFKEYLDTELLSKSVMPDMSPRLRKEINRSIFEIFNNAVLHANCRNIFTCGQFFPQKNKLDFTVVDMGITIPGNVNNFLNETLAGHDALAWAVEEGHTTKIGKIPGGLGLSLIRDFLKINRGKMQIISGDGYWEQDVYNNIDTNCIPDEFPGTIVNFEFNVNVDGFYCLKSEVDAGDIF
jgi:hypothetical protein